MRPFDEDMPIDENYGDVALLVASARDWPSEEFTRDLDTRVARRFAPVAPAAARPARSRRMRWVAGPVAGLAVAGVAAVIVLSQSGGGGTLNGFSGLVTHAQSNGSGQLAPAARKLPATNTTATTVGQPHSGAGQAGSGGVLGAYANSTSSAGVKSPATFAAPPASGGSDALGGKQIQSAQVSLATANQHVEQVSSEVLNVVSVEHGVVENAHTTAARLNSGGGYASFRLSIPTSNLQDAMTQLSRLHYASVSSRTDATQNVSSQYTDDQRRLNDDNALRTSLLKQLQTAYTTSAIDSIKAQLKLAEQQIAGAESTLHSLQHRIGYSIVTVQINAGGPLVAPVAKSSGFTIQRAGHDAERVLVVSAGVALISLAVLIPVGLVAALLMWLWVWLRQRRREQALDAVK